MIASPIVALAPAVTLATLGTGIAPDTASVRSAWFDFWTGAREAGGQTVDAAAPIERMPVFVRAGSIVPLGPVKPYADAPSDEPVELRVYPGASGDFAAPRLMSSRATRP